MEYIAPVYVRQNLRFNLRSTVIGDVEDTLLYILSYLKQNQFL